MKQLFFKSVLATLLFIELTAFSTFAVHTDYTYNNNNPEAIESHFRPKVTISFIIARRRDCLGFGICQISIDVTTAKVNSGTGTLYADKNTMILEIDKNTGIVDECYAKYFASGKFLMEDESPVPNDILKELGISGSRILQPGNHTITERNGKLYVVIPVK